MNQTPVLDGTAGIDSTGGVHGWPKATNSWGDGRTIDDWTYADVDVPTGEIPIEAACPDIQVTKTSDPESGSTVNPGDMVEYTLTYTNTGDAAGSVDSTDDLSEVLDDASLTGGPNSDTEGITTEVTGETLSVDGTLHAGATATVTYEVTVNDPLTGDGELSNAVVGPPDSNCEEGSEDPDCNTDVLVRALHIEKTSDGAEGAQPGDTVTYTVTVENTGQVPYTTDDPATFDDDLTQVLDDATYNGDASADVGTASYSDPTLSWSGPLDPGQTATVTYSVTVNDPATGDGDMFNVVVGPEESNCTDPQSEDPDCIEPDPIAGLTITKSSDPTDEVLPGDTVTYTVTVENTGEVDYTADEPATFSDDLTNVLDDATYNDDAAADTGDVTYSEPELSWAGPLETGETATITYSVTVNDPDEGDGSLDNAVVGPDESNCPPDSDEPDCNSVVPIKALEIVKTADPSGEVSPGGVVDYTVTVTNTGQVPYTTDEPATFSDDLTNVLDDASYNDDAAADIGTASYVEPTLSWSGPLEPGETATVTYSVTVNDPVTGDGVLDNAVVGPEESNCDDGSEDGCHVPVPVKALEITKSADPAGEVDAGATVAYTVTVENTGGAAYTADDPASFSDDLSEVLDDAVYDGDASADIGAVSYGEPTLSWSGPLEPGEVATITYSVMVNNPVSGDGTLDNAVVGPDESNCPPDSEDPECNPVVPIKALHLEKTSDGMEGATPGDTVTYSVTVTNTGQVAYTEDEPATFDDDLTEVLDDATYNDDAAADVGTTSYTVPTLSWSGALEPGATATITYSVTINDPDEGDGQLFNVVVGPEESNCTDPEESADPDCIEPDLVKDLEILKTADPEGAITAGDTVTYTVTVTNTGEADYTADDPAFFTDDLTNVLDDAVYNDDTEASSGEVSFEEPELSWSGALAPGDSATVTYSVTSNDPLTGDGTLANAVLGPQESNCPVSLPDGGGGMAVGVLAAFPEMPEGCQIVTPIRSYEVSKTSDNTEAAPGDVVGYTVTVQSVGAAPYTEQTPAGITDDLTKVIDDATWNGDASATAGSTSYTEPTLTWSGPLGIDETVTVTYSVTVNDPDEGDGTLTNVVVPTDGSGGGCTSGDECTTNTDVAPPDQPVPPAPGPNAGPAGDQPGGSLPRTGAELIGTLLALALALTLGGFGLYRHGQRRRQG